MQSKTHVEGPEEPQHLAVRLESALQAWQIRRSLAKGYVRTVLPYTGYGSTSWIRVLGRVVLSKSVRKDGPEALKTLREGIRGWRNFMSPPIRYATVTVEVAGETHRVSADRGGVIDVRIPVRLELGANTVRLTSDDSATVESTVFVISDDAEFGVVSDIDDTVMVTALPRPLLAAWNTFVVDEHARNATPGMAVMMERVTQQHRGTPVLYLSTGAWNVAPTLTRFLSRNLYPAGPLLLTDWGPTLDRWFRSGLEHKRSSLARLAREFPDIKWLLIGDDGQHDEAIYAEFSRTHPENVTAVAIRQLSVGEAVLAGGRSSDTADHSSDAPWIYAPDGAGISEKLEDLGFLASDRDRVPEVPDAEDAADTSP
ncbi:App1 family protein [Arthrobacter roseus]|uniref:App1 family protein n=1 Tax=Arthrobacter roseus TaxID=136274 RepID=UPI0019635E9E|nr:phosphatase domain-containing protein [Arthrobacter roseus]MBM7848762.1 phosphatidate phosphatase APP1 [Arthrobacter roseus]